MSEDKSIQMSQKIQIMLAEYTVLQTEIIHRKNNGFQIFAVALPIALGLVYDAPAQRLSETFISLAGFAIVFGYAGYLLFRSIKRASGRIREIEQYVNDLAGEKLLVY
jgi:hypothetical protein